MKTQFFTRNARLGVLLVFVLAFSVQGNLADALEFKDHTSTDGDLQTVLAGDEFKIKFSMTLGSNTTKIYNAAGELIAESEDGPFSIDSSGFILDANGNRVNAAGDDGVAIDSSGYQLDSDGNRVNADESSDPPEAGTIAINSSGFKLDADGDRVTVEINGKTFYTLVDKEGAEVTVDSSKYQVDSDGNRVNADESSDPPEAGTIAINSSGFKLDADGDRVTVEINGKTFYTLVDEEGAEVTVDSFKYQVETAYGNRVKVGLWRVIHQREVMSQ